MITEIEAENIVKEILRLKETGLTENLQLYTPLREKFDLNEDDVDLALEMISTGAFRAGLMSSGNSYPPFMNQRDINPIFKAAFKLAWIDFKGEDHFNANLPKPN